MAKTGGLGEPAWTAVMWLRLSLTAETAMEPPAFPSGVVLSAFVPERHARKARALLKESYASGDGDVQAFEDWWRALQAEALCRWLDSLFFSCFGSTFSNKFKTLDSSWSGEPDRSGVG